MRLLFRYWDPTGTTYCERDIWPHKAGSLVGPSRKRPARWTLVLPIVCSVHDGRMT